jgi:SPP1 gp7 family putative phage head morphogenesis protein
VHFSLAALIRRARNPRRRQIPIRDISAPAVLATDLYRSVYMPIVQAWERAIAGLLSSYELTLAQMTTDSYDGAEANSVPESGLRVSCSKTSGARLQDDTPGAMGPNPIAVRLTDSPADIEAELRRTESEVERVLLELTPRLREWILRVERFHRAKWRAGVLSAAGVDLDTLIGPQDVAETIDALIGRNVGLVKDVSAEARRRIADSIYRGLTERRPARDVAREIREAVEMGRDRAQRIASDQLTKATSALDSERMRQAGIDAWDWIHSGKLHPREEHLARHRKRYSFSNPPSDMPGEKPFCGCRKLAVVEFD